MPGSIAQYSALSHGPAYPLWDRDCRYAAGVTSIGERTHRDRRCMTTAWERGEPSGVLGDAGRGKGSWRRAGLSSIGRTAAGVQSTGFEGPQS